MRERAEEILRRLAGPAATLREDQWSAIDALVTQRRRVLLVQRTGFASARPHWLPSASGSER